MAPPRANPLIDDRTVEFLLYEVLDVEGLCNLSDFGEHNRHTFDLVLASARTLARRGLFPHYRTVDASPPVLREPSEKRPIALRPSRATTRASALSDSKSSSSAGRASA